ncbi:MAG: DUF3943 domain-containing protein [Treponema sp.]|nr:DUF3943 domain-containing protein [Treponema sp.]
MDFKTPRLLFFLVLLLCVRHTFLFSYDEDIAPAGGIFRRGLIATGQTILSNTVLMSFNIGVYQFTGNFTWAQPNLSSLRHNLGGPGNWKWEDTDGFVVNHFGHPYQGSTYFSAGRVNNFTFYQSIFFNAFGSLTWEIFHENNASSINDMLTTIPSGISMGEMLYRLYVQAINSGVPAGLAFFINPMAGFNRLVTGWEPPDYGTRLYQVRTYLGMGHAWTHSSLPGGGALLYRDLRSYPIQRPFGNAGFSIIYGNPFQQENRTPFQHFQLAFSLGLDLGNYMDFRLVSDGYLFSFSPVYSNTSRMSSGLSLHLDAASIGRFNWYRGSSINKYSNALNWTVKYQRLFPQGTDVQIKSHFGVTFFGSSVFYCPDLMGDLNNFGGGLNGKIFLNVNHWRLGSLEVSLLGYTMWSYPIVTHFSGRGTVFWLFNDVTYFYHFSNRTSLGITHSLALERGVFSEFPDTRKMNRALRLFMAWNF